MDKELEIEGGCLSYRTCGNEVTVLSGRVSGSSIKIPEKIEGIPVTKLEKKAFLSCKNLKEVYLPRGLKEIGDWTFAYCSALERVWMPKVKMDLGRGIFKECERLVSICHLDGDSLRKQQTGYLLGAVPIKLEADYLFTPEQAGEVQWLSRFDDKLKEFLARPDEEGYTKMVYCGEEDIVANMDLFLAERRREKARLCFLRLINDVELKDEFKKELSGYLAAHTVGCASQAAWEVVFLEHGNEQEYYEAFTGAGCFGEENYDQILSCMGERYPEMKGYLMRYKAQQLESTDFFDLLSLD
ncbi:leucine-rich repeat protein [Lachnospiraceae bacterium 64-25]